MASVGMVLTIREGKPMYGQIVAQDPYGSWRPYIPILNGGNVVIKGNQVSITLPGGQPITAQSFASAPLKDFNSMYTANEPISPNKLDTDAKGKPIVKEYVNYCYMVNARFD